MCAAAPGTSYGKVTSLNNGAVVNIVGIDNGWYKISTNGVTGYVSSELHGHLQGLRQFPRRRRHRP